MLRDRGPQQGLEIPESLQPRESQSPKPQALPSPQLRLKECQAVPVCQVKRKGLLNKLQVLASGNKYALHDIYGPGFQIYLAGSVTYVTQCIPVEARLYDPTNCTEQIPAEIGSKEYMNVTQKYANAQTMILQDFPTKVP
jgi:hypothetical protein